MLTLWSSVLNIVISVMGCLATLTAQVPPSVANGQQMLATKQYLFVVHDGVLHPFDIRTLKLRKKVRLSGAKEMLADEAKAKKAAARAKQAFDEAVRQPAPTAPSAGCTSNKTSTACSAPTPHTTSSTTTR